ncbi:MAG: M48 family metallopeptidase, partial [Rhizobiaceae bacterium]|nr:M48 family metallopeptidase [Rhizobiaceae bacterium]
MPLGLFRTSKTRTPPQPETRDHAVAGRTLPLRIVESDRARRLTLRIDAGGRGLRITVPPGLARGEVDRFLLRHQGWLEQRLEKIPERPQVRPGTRLPLRGVPHRIVHEPDRRGTVVVQSGADGPELVVHGDRLHLPRRLADFLKREARKDITALVDKHTATVGRKAKAIRFKDTTSRWGS